MSSNFTLLIRFANDHTSEMIFGNALYAMRYARDHISYSGGKIQRVELIDNYGNKRALWDRSWDGVSQAAGLMIGD